MRWVGWDFSTSSDINSMPIRLRLIPLGSIHLFVLVVHCGATPPPSTPEQASSKSLPRAMIKTTTGAKHLRKHPYHPHPRGR